MFANPDVEGRMSIEGPKQPRCSWLPRWVLRRPGLLFCTMRRSNGLCRAAAPHQRLPVCGWGSDQRRRATDPAQAGGNADSLQPGAAPIGPYHVLANLGAPPPRLAPWLYPRLFRKVWLCVVPAGTPR